MTKARLLALLATVLVGSTGAWAQKASNGKLVRRVTFDRENVTINYKDGSADEKVSTAVIVNTPTGIKLVSKEQGTDGARSIYSIDGRRLQGTAAKTGKGVYIVKEGKTVRKVTKK